MNDFYTDHWQLPDGVNELLPEEAWQVEALRRQFVDHCYRCGYELVMPPLIEYLDSLLTGTGETLDLQTFKLVDQHNGRSLGIRADMTTQVARMDAHALQSDAPNRLCYTGTVIKARTDGVGSSRAPLQFGAELFGHAGPQSDIEIIQLMLDSVFVAGLTPDDVVLDLGHVGVYRALIQQASLEPLAEEALFDALLRGSRPDVMRLLAEADCPERLRQAIADLFTLSGNYLRVLDRARAMLADAGLQVQQALDALGTIAQALADIFPDMQISMDLGELRGYRYHTGTLFTLYERSGAVISSGGRYDAIGEAFGKARAATGFTGDLLNLARLVQQQRAPRHKAPEPGILAPRQSAPGLKECVRSLRASGHRVVTPLDDNDEQSLRLQYKSDLTLFDDEWNVVDR